MKVRPLGDKILVKRAEARDKTDAGIFLPEAAKDQPKEGKVLAVGSGILNKNTGEYMPFTVREGDQVIFSTYSGTEVKIGDDEMLILSEDDILCVVE